ncbi:MAG: YHS domain-containing protein [Deltaproteobacteria bacterium]|nr:YHS domain-containing protein [Deltaproteobacteria bacterium]
MSILRFIVAVVVVYLLYKLVRGIVLLFWGNRAHTGNREITGREDLVEDPWCHTYIPQSSAYQTVIDGKTVYFCSRDCYKKFKEERKKRQG